MIHSGIDWSEEPDGSWIVIAIAHVDAADLPNLDRELAEARNKLKIGRFKHLEAKPATHEAFYAAIQRVRSFRAHVYRFDRRAWAQRHVKPLIGDACICDGITTLLQECPQELIAQQMAHIDFPRVEQRVVQAFRTAIRKSMRMSKLPTLKDLRPRPDDRSDGAIIQAADMIAGEVREYGGIGGPYLPLLSRRIRCI